MRFPLRVRFEAATFALLAGAFLLANGVTSPAWQVNYGLGLALCVVALLREWLPQRAGVLPLMVLGTLSGFALAQLLVPHGLGLAAVGVGAVATAGRRRRQGFISTGALAGVVLLGVWEGLRGYPAGARLAVELDEAWRSLAGACMLDGARVRPSFHYSGLQYVLIMLAGLALEPSTRARWRSYAARALGAALLAWITHHLLVGQCGVSMTMGAVLLPVWAPLFFVMLLCTSLRGKSPRYRGVPGSSQGVLVAGALLLAVMTGELAILAGQPQIRRVRIAALDVGLQDWDRPQHGRYGSHSSGMFGTLPLMCEAAGASLHVIPRAGLTNGSLDDADVLLLINLNRMLRHDELARVQSFVERGGVCVVLTDHTNVAGVMRPTNAVLEPYGIRARFDSAKNFGRWFTDFGRSVGPVFSKTQREHHFPYGIGASLELSGSAFPLVTARHAFSDVGVAMNYVGAYLGNYRVDVGESVGDVTLVAAATAGTGAVIVFGDTTPFQNNAIARAGSRFLAPFLASTASRMRLGTGLVWLGAALLVSLALVRVRRGADVLAVCGVLIAVSLRLVGAQEQLDGLTSESAPAPICTSVEVSPRDCAPVRPRRRGGWSFGQSFQRAGFLYLRTHDLDASVLRESSVLLFVLPLARIPMQDELVQYVRAGGHVVFVGGARHARALKGFFAEFGIGVRTMAYGIVPQYKDAVMRLEGPRFPSAYGIHVESASRWPVDVLLASGDIVAAARLRCGKGSVTVLADDALPYGSNVEGENAWHLGNLAFLDRIWQLLKQDSPRR